MPIIAVSGPHGSGKSTAARKVAESLGYEYVSAGELFRDMAKEENMSLEEFSKHAELKEEIDKYIDDKTLEMLGDADVYFIYGVNEKKIGSKLIENLNRCKQHDIEVHISVNPLRLSYTNIWTFERLRDETEEVLDFLRKNNFLEDTITTLVYDMEMLK
ncbi:MAG: AAA family ATPase, partial [Candidatus Heimdallarchaeota archaeon]|nr:AAA family ATPase [Candidatus Heimdallarchaeota archaeon]MCK5144144.1 AAA family ATPase [Candidatus Heimdallarchaeota archaeon]